MSAEAHQGSPLRARQRLFALLLGLVALALTLALYGAEAALTLLQRDGREELFRAREARGEPVDRRDRAGLPLLRDRVARLRGRWRPEPAPSADTLALLVRVLARGREVAASWGGDLRVAYLPRDQRLAPGVPPSPTADAVLAAAEKLGLPALDLTSALRPGGAALYAYPSGTPAGPSHLNEQGYSVAAAALLPFVTAP